MDLLFPLICIIGVNFSMDEMTMCFKGQNTDKIRMKYKGGGGGLQRDALFQKIYMYQILMCNYPVSKTHLYKSLSPLYFRVMALFDVVE